MGLLADQATGIPAAPTAAGLAQSAAAAGAPGPQPEQAVTPPAGAPQEVPAGQGRPAPVATAPAAPVQGGMATGMDIGEEPASTDEQKEYERSMQAVAKVLYSNSKTSKAIVNQIDPSDKVGSTAKASMLFIRQLDEKLDMDEAVISEVTQEAVSRIMELAEARYGFEYDPREAQVILGSTWEGVMQIFGMDEEGHQDLVRSTGSEKLPELKQQYEAALNG